MDGKTATAKRKVKIVIFYSAKATQFSKFFSFDFHGGSLLSKRFRMMEAVWVGELMHGALQLTGKIAGDSGIGWEWVLLHSARNTWTYLLVFFFLLFNILSLFIITFPATSCFLQTGGVVHSHSALGPGFPHGSALLPLWVST